MGSLYHKYRSRRIIHFKKSSKFGYSEKTLWKIWVALYFYLFTWRIFPLIIPNCWYAKLIGNGLATFWCWVIFEFVCGCTSIWNLETCNYGSVKGDAYNYCIILKENTLNMCKQANQHKFPQEQALKIPTYLVENTPTMIGRIICGRVHQKNQVLGLLPIWTKTIFHNIFMD